MIGVTDLAYLQADDEELYDEVIDTVGELAYRVVEKILSIYDGFDFAHFWEDICFKNGPLISPRVFREKVGPHYKRITDMLAAHGIDIVSLDCDGCIDKLVPVWLDNGVNTMFPIEVGVWDASIAPWRAQYGAQVRGVGGMNKTVFARERAGYRRRGGAAQGTHCLGRLYSLPRSPHCARCQIGERAVLLRENAGASIDNIILSGNGGVSLGYAPIVIPGGNSLPWAVSHDRI